AEGAGRIARLAAEAGATQLVHISAIGADDGSDSAYARTKAEGEAAVRAAFPAAVILRPSAIFVPEDGLTNRIASMARLGPILPVVGGGTRFQPVHVEDVAEAAVRGATGAAGPGTYELGGPEVMTMRKLAETVLGVVRRRRLVLNMPFWKAGLL